MTELHGRRNWGGGGGGAGGPGPSSLQRCKKNHGENALEWCKWGVKF